MGTEVRRRAGLGVQVSNLESDQETQARAEPNCRRCAQEGYSVTATHVAHVEPHQGQWSRFMEYANTQSLCSRHHKAQRRGHVRQLL
jgi:hypothetical protein